MTYDAAYRPGRVIVRDDDEDAVSQCYLEGSAPPPAYDHDIEFKAAYDDGGSSNPASPTLLHTDALRGAPAAPTGFYGYLGTRLVGFAGKVLDGGRHLFLLQRQHAQTGEGPSLLRFLCFLGGFGMLMSSILSMINIFSFLTGPSAYVLQVYQGFFGVIIMVIEAKDWDWFDRLKPWLIEWFRFLSVPAGKGAFYIFVGSLGVSLWVRNIIAFAIGLYMGVLGLMCIAVHAGATKKQQQHEPLMAAAGDQPEQGRRRAGQHADDYRGRTDCFLQDDDEDVDDIDEPSPRGGGGQRRSRFGDGARPYRKGMC